jgi:hypothetical protein
MKGYVVKREIWASYPAIDGRFKDENAAFREKKTKKMFYNTHKLLQYGVTIPVTDGHPPKTGRSNDETLHGKLLKVYLEKRDQPSPHYAIVGDMFIDEQFYALYKDGKLPGASIEYTNYANLEAYAGFPDEIKSEVIYSVALMGQTPEGMPALKEISVDPQPYQIFARFKKSEQCDFSDCFYSFDPLKIAIIKLINNTLLVHEGDTLAPQILEDLKTYLINLIEQEYPPIGGIKGFVPSVPPTDGGPGGPPITPPAGPPVTPPAGPPVTPPGPPPAPPGGPPITPPGPPNNPGGQSEKIHK